MLKLSVSHPRRVWAIVGAIVAVVVLAGVWRLSAGPMAANWLKPAIEQAIAGQVEGGRARLDQVSVGWFPDEHAFGLRLDGLRLDDGRGRAVARAHRLDAALALDALPGLELTPARLSADHFFAAVSVSPQGRYALGYEAAGAPKAAGAPAALDELLLELTGKPRLDRRLSFVRLVSLTDGRVALRQIGGGPAWTADVRRLVFRKSGGQVTADAEVTVEGDRRPAIVDAYGRASVGLSDAFVRADVENLVPARIFPSVGPTAPLSGLDAVVQGRGSLAYDFHSGVRAADIAAEAGPGAWRFGGAVQAFKSAQIAANYMPATREVVLSAFRVEAERTRLDLTGQFRLDPEDAARKSPARLEYRIAGPSFVWRLADDAPPQELHDVLVRGRLIPQQKRLEFDEARATVAGAPLSAHGVVFRDAHDRVGAQLEARIAGRVGPDQIFAFWPKRFVWGVRGYLRRAILDGRFSNVAFRLNARPGDMRPEGLNNDELSLRFGFDGGAFRFAGEFPAITDGEGQAVLKGDRFDLDLDAGRIGDVALSQGTVEMPTFRVRGADAVYRFAAQGPVRDMLAVLDGPKLHLISGAGFDRTRTSGEAAVDIEVRRPMLFAAPKDSLKVAYAGVIRDGGLKDAALGWDLADAALELKGDEKGFTLRGRGGAGPYKGGLKFDCDFGREGKHGQLLALDGTLDASILGGPEGRASPFAGRFTLGRDGGSGFVHAAVFSGRVGWKDGDGPNRFLLQGWGDGVGLRRAGAPFTQGLPDRFPAEVRFDRSGAVWRGPIRADALSGAVTFTAGAQPRLVYETDVTPLKARRLGLAQIPLFDTQRSLVVDATWSGPQGTADVRSGGLVLQLGWGGGEHRVRADLTPADLTALGLPPLSMGGASVPVTAVWSGAGDRIAGSGQAADTPFHFQTAPAGDGGQVLMAQMDLDQNALRRLGLPAALRMDGKAGVLARVSTSDRSEPTGRIELDLGRADLSIEGADWRKPAGRPGRATIDFAKEATGAVRLTHVTAQSDGLDLDGSAVLVDGKVQSADFDRTRLAGLIDASIRLAREAGGELDVDVKGRQFDARRWFRRAREQGGAGEAGGAATHAPQPAPVKIDAAFDQVQLTDDTRLDDVRVAGVWGGRQSTRLDIAAQTVNGGRVRGRLFPQGGLVAVAAETTDAGEVAKGLFGVKDLKGGSARITGHLVEGGADLQVELHDVRVVHAPAMAQLLTVASFKGLADTLNGEGVLFNHVVAPLEVRGSRLVLGEARATGSALGITAEGVADLQAGKMDIRGTLAPAYAINSAMGAVPVLGQLLTSRKGEGIVGLGYYAKGAIDKPQVMVNPLSLVTPGILRRMFEAGPAPADVAAPSSSAHGAAGSTTAGD